MSCATSRTPSPSVSTASGSWGWGYSPGLERCCTAASSRQGWPHPVPGWRGRGAARPPREAAAGCFGP
eukprot:7440993-Alexandrium_andersonii.AAC.1